MTDPDENAMNLEPDDPRISEWIDGRLPAAEAAAIERAVQATPALAALVADLRAIKAASRDVGRLAPPAGFTDRVMAAVTAAAPAGDHPVGFPDGGHPTGDPSGDEAVDQEWEAVEAERIAAERAEAAADLAEAARGHRRRPWPWMALAGALAAGVLVTVVLNLPGDGRRDVALAPAMAPRDLDEEPTVAARSLAAAKPAPPPPAAVTSADSSPADEMPATPIASARDPSASTAPLASDPSARGSSGPTSLGRKPEDSRSSGNGDADDRPVAAVTVRGPSGRAAFEQRAATLGLAIAAAGEGGSRDAEVVAISGPADAIERLLAETRTPLQPASRGRQAETRLESADDREGLEPGEAGEAEKQNAARLVEPRLQQAQAAAITRVLVRLIELPASAESQPAKSQPAKPAEPADAEGEPGDTEQ